MSTSSRAATASAASSAMCASSASRAPVSTITCWIVGDLVVVEARRPDALEHVAARPASASSHGPRQQRRRLALAQVVADRLAGERRVAEGADDVVAHLEGVAERQAVAAQPGQQLGPALGRGEHGADVERALDRVLAALVAGDALGLGEAPLALHRAEDVEVLADVELDAQLVPELPDLRSARRSAAGRRARRRGRRRGSPRLRRSGATRRPTSPCRARRRRRRASSGRRGGWPSRPSRRRGTGRRRASARTPRRRAPTRSSSGSPPAPTNAPVAERRPQPLAARAHHAVDLVERRAEVGVERGPARRALGRQQLVEATTSTRAAIVARVGGGAGVTAVEATAAPFEHRSSPSRSAMTSSMRRRAWPMRSRHSAISSVARATRSARRSTSTSVPSSSRRMPSSSSSAWA